MQKYNTAKVAVVLLIFIFVGVAAIKPTVNEEFKNLQVLPKNISSDSLDVIMENFNQGLGVNCNYCHVNNLSTSKMEFEKDDKSEKEIARLMLRMTLDINNKYFKFNEDEKIDSFLLKPVTCLTCHRGEPRPFEK